jgi:cyclic pyranopterin phosphate synthase
MTDKHLSHYDSQGHARMVDISGKAVTERRAVARGRIRVSPETLTAIGRGMAPKGDPFEVARVAGISAAKKTSALIPLCHPLRLNVVDVSIAAAPDQSAVEVTVAVSASERTGVEMEALVGCGVALLTLYDMLKAIDPTMVIEGIRVVEKTGGKNDFSSA